MAARRLDPIVLRGPLPVPDRNRGPNVGDIVCHWVIIGHGRAGYDLARCLHCKETHEARFDALTSSGDCNSYVPRCPHCGMTGSGEIRTVRRPKYVTGR